MFAGSLRLQKERVSGSRGFPVPAKFERTRHPRSADLPRAPKKKASHTKQSIRLRHRAANASSRVVRYSPMILAVASATNKIVAAQVRTVTQNNWRMANSCIRMIVV
jgi:hypothetical protein